MVRSNPRAIIYFGMSGVCVDVSEDTNELQREHECVACDSPDAFDRIKLVRDCCVSVSVCCTRIQEHCDVASRGPEDEVSLLEQMRVDVNSIFSALDSLVFFAVGTRHEDVSKMRLRLKRIRLQTTFMVGYINLACSSIV